MAHLEVVEDVDLLLLGGAVLVQSQQLAEDAVERVAVVATQLETHRYLGHLETRPGQQRLTLPNAEPEMRGRVGHSVLAEKIPI